MSHFGTSLLIPIPKNEEENLIVKGMAEKESFSYELDYKANENAKVYQNGHRDSYLLSDDSEEGNLH